MTQPLGKKTETAPLNSSMHIESQLLATKFVVPVASHPLISRPRLSVLLDESLKYPLTLVSAPAGFGKTSLLSTWGQAQLTSNALVAWVSLDEGDNDPQLFWTYILAALDQQQPERFVPLLKRLQSPQAPSLKYVLTALINLFVDSAQHFVLILDDYHVITEQQIHTSLSFMIEHLPPHFHIILSARADPPLSLSQLRAGRQVLEVRADQLCCTAEETGALFEVAMGIQLPDETIQEVVARTEGWLVGLQLLALSLSEHVSPLDLLNEVSGDQRYILDYLTEEVLQRQSQDVQTFLLSTCILERLTASLCDAVMEQSGSQRMLERLEQANMFIVSLDAKHQWYRYHPLFAQALYYQLEHTHGELMLLLYHRASLWYAKQDQITEAILHALNAHQWQWAADLIEQKGLSIPSLTWGASQHAMVKLRQWLERLPTDIIGSRARFCFTCAQLLWSVTSPFVLKVWLDTAEARVTASLEAQTHTMLEQEQKNLLGEISTLRAIVGSTIEDGDTTLALCRQALALLPEEDVVWHTLVDVAQLHAYYAFKNDTVAAIQSGLHGGLLAQTAGYIPLAISLKGIAACYMVGAGRLHEAQQLTKQAMQLGKGRRELVLPDVGWPALFQAEILREWNQLDMALLLVKEAVSQCKQTTSTVSLLYLLCGYAVLLRVHLSRGELDEARSALQQLECLGMNMNQPTYIYYHSLFTTVDQVRLWLVRGELNIVTYWVEQLKLAERHSSPFTREREEVACVRVLLAQHQPTVALQRLELVLERATSGWRWNHVIEVRLLQALAYQMCQQEALALSVLLEALYLAEPEGYVRRFVDEGAPMAGLLSRLREEQRDAKLTSYLDRLLAAFPQQSNVRQSSPKRAGKHSTARSLSASLSERELEVLRLLARGASNQEIAQELAIVVDTVKRHVSQIFSKLGVKNRVQAVRQARALGLLGEEF
jgi:LuxR family maltose regulon positive regulatory protein